MIWRRIIAAACTLAMPLAAQAQEGQPEPEPPRTEAADDNPVEISQREVQIGILRHQAAAQRGAGRDAEAVETLGRLIVLLGTEYGNDSARLIEPLLLAADLQSATGQFGAAATSFERVIGIIEQNESVFSESLIEPLSDLANIYNRLGRSEQAVEILRRARHITHRQLGILNMEQLDLADQLAESYFRLGQIGEANRENRFAFRVNERQFGPDSPELVPALNKLGGWYERIGEHSYARRSYRRAVELLEQSYGPDDVRVADPLRRIARSYLEQNEPLREGEKSLLRAIEIYQSSPGVDVAEHAASLIELGDWLMLVRRRDQAMEKYVRAWDLLTDNGSQPDKALSLLGRPKRLRFTPPLSDEGMMRGASQVYIDVRFSVTPAGAVRDVEVVGGDAHWQMKRDFREAIHKAKFRPRFENGEPVLTENILFRYTYRVEGERETVSSETVSSVDRAGDEELP